MSEIGDVAGHFLELAKDSKQFGTHKDDPVDADGLAAIFHYTDEEGTTPPLYKVMNSRCYEKNRKLVEPFLDYIWALLHALLILVPFVGTVFRGVTKNLADQYPKGRTVTWWGFSSCTTDLETLENPLFFGKEGARTFFHIELTQSQARSIAKYSLIDGEAEVLLPPGCRFEVTGRLRSGDVTMIYLKEIESEELILDLRPKGPTSPVGSAAGQGGAAASGSSQAAATAKAAGYAAAGASEVDYYQLGMKGGGEVNGRTLTKQDCLQLAVEADAAHAHAWMQLSRVLPKGGQVVVVAGQPRTGKQCAEAALSLDSSLAAAWNSLGFHQGGSVNGEEFSSKQCSEKALSLNPQDAYAWSGLGVAGGGNVGGRHYDAKTCFVKALELGEEHQINWNGLAKLGGGTINGRFHSPEACSERAKELGSSGCAIS